MKFYILLTEKLSYLSIYSSNNSNQSLYFGFELYMDQFSAKQIYKDINDFVHQFIDELCLIDITEKVFTNLLRSKEKH